MSRHPTDTGGGICNAIPHCKRDERVICPACEGRWQYTPCKHCKGKGEVTPLYADIITRKLKCNGTRIG